MMIFKEILRIPSKYLRGISLPIIAAMLALMVIGITAISVAEQAARPNSIVQGSTLKQCIYAVVGIVAFIAAVVVPYRRIGQSSYILFGINLSLLILVLFLPPIRNSHRWINLRIFKVQPSELIKVTYVVALAWYLRYRDNYRRASGLIAPFMLTLIPAVLILIEPDLGTTLLLFPTLFFMLFMAGAKLRHLVTVIILAAAAALMPIPIDTTGKDDILTKDRKALAYWSGKIGKKEYTLLAGSLSIMKPHQLARIEGWIKQSDRHIAMSKGFQLQVSMFILGSGGLTGEKMTRQKNIYFRMLPDDHTDFIYTIIGGQWGFLGCLAVLFIYLVIFFFGAEIAGTTDDPFGRLLVLGMLGLLFSQVFINLGMTMGLMPITGMTLPLISYGGSSMVVNCIAMGLMINVAHRRPRLLGRKPFEHGKNAQEETASIGPLFQWAQNSNHNAKK